jgi:hypothetical protein
MLDFAAKINKVAIPNELLASLNSLLFSPDDTRVAKTLNPYKEINNKIRAL